jgi:hypothetical protein
MSTQGIEAFSLPAALVANAAIAVLILISAALSQPA